MAFDATTLAAGLPLIEAVGTGAPLARRAAAEPRPSVVPRLFFREKFPKASGSYPRIHAPPELTLQTMRDVVVGHSRVLLGKEPAGVLRPSLNRLRRELHPSFAHVDGLFHAREPADFAEVAKVDGPVYWADTSYREVYGHLLLEALPQLWGYREAGVRTVATSVPRSRTRDVLLEAMGVAPENVLELTGCIEPSEVVVATPPVMLRDYVHPEAHEIFARLGQLARQSSAPTPEKLYVSRSRAARRTLRNEAEIEAIFADAGFAIYHPQEHTIEDQIRTFSGARLIAGPGGSALHTAVFAGQLEKLLILCSPNWFTLIDLLLHQHEGRVALLFGTIAPEQEALRPAQREWAIDAHQARLTLRFHMGL